MDIVINKLTLVGDSTKIDQFFDDQVENNKLSFNKLIPMPSHLENKLAEYEVEFIYSNFSNALVFTKSGSNFKYKHVNANIYSYIEDFEQVEWMKDNWNTSSDIYDQDLIITRKENTVEIIFTTKFSTPFIWFHKLASTYKDLKCTLESMSYQYTYYKYEIDDNGVLNYEHESMPFYYQFDSLGLIEDTDLNLKETIGYYD